MLTEASHLMIGATFCLWKREVVSIYVSSVLIYSAVSHCLTMSDASDLAEREISGSRKILTVYPTPYEYLVKKESIMKTPSTV